MVNSGAQADSVISISTVVNGTRLDGIITSGKSINGGGGERLLLGNFNGAFNSGTSYQVRISFNSGSQLSLIAIASGI